VRVDVGRVPTDHGDAMSTRLRILGATMLVASLACRPARTSTPPPDTASDDDDEFAAAHDETDAEDPDADAPQVAALAADRPPRTIYRAELDRALARGPGWLLGQLDPEPVRNGGRFVGWRIASVFPDAPDVCPPGCDLLPGDVILAVQGDPLQTPHALEAMIARLDALSALEIDRVRDGTREHVVYTLLDAP
jgi:type II secretory pathway component PulC